MDWLIATGPSPAKTAQVLTVYEEADTLPGLLGPEPLPWWGKGWGCSVWKEEGKNSHTRWQRAEPGNRCEKGSKIKRESTAGGIIHEAKSTPTHVASGDFGKSGLCQAGSSQKTVTIWFPSASFIRKRTAANSVGPTASERLG